MLVFQYSASSTRRFLYKTRQILAVPQKIIIQRIEGVGIGYSIAAESDPMQHASD